MSCFGAGLPHQPRPGIATCAHGEVEEVHIPPKEVALKPLGKAELGYQQLVSRPASTQWKHHLLGLESDLTYHTDVSNVTNL